MPDNQQQRRITRTLIKLAAFEVNSSDDGGAWWTVSDYERANKTYKKILDCIEKHLSNSLSTEQRKSMSYKVISSVGEDLSQLNLGLSFLYTEGCDLDIESFFNAVENIAINILKTINMITNAKNIDLNSTIIKEHHESSSEHKDGIIYVPKGISKTIYQILETFPKSNTVNCTAGEEKFRLNLPRINKSIIQSDTVEYIEGFVLGVLDDTRKILIKSDKSKEFFTYDPTLRKDLLTAQSEVTEIKIQVLSKYENIQGIKKIRGGHLVAFEVKKDNIQLTL
jgi:hypothetical protein